MKISSYNKLFLCTAMLLLGILSNTTAHAQTAVWTNRYNGSGNGVDQATAIAVDTNGNVFVTGSSVGSSSLADFSTIKYSGAGVALWTNRYNGPANNADQATAMAVDGSGNVFVTGQSLLSGFYDYATIKYSGAGTGLWTNGYNGPAFNSDFANAIAVDNSGNVFVTGTSYGGGGVGTSDYTTIKYSGAGGGLWTNRYNGPANGIDQAKSVAVDSNGNVFVTGYSSGSGSQSDYATIKYSGAGATLWTNRYNGTANAPDVAVAIALDSNGNVFVTGYSYGSGSSADYVTIKYSGAGVALWTNRYDGPVNGDDTAYAMAIDVNGNVFVTGYSDGAGSINDYATIAYSGAGEGLWTNRYNGPGNGQDIARAMAVDGSGNVLVTGTSNGGGSTNDYATIAYSGAGVALWTNRYNGTGNSVDQASAIAVDRSGNVFVTGYSTGSGSTNDYVTIKYSAIPPSLTVARTTTNKVVVSWLSPSTGFTLQSTTNLVSPVTWNTNLPAPVVINGQNTVTNPISGTQQFFRLKQ